MTIAEALLRLVGMVVGVLLLTGMASIAFVWYSKGQEEAARMVDRWFGWSDWR